MAGRVVGLWLTEPGPDEETLLETVKAWLDQEDLTTESPLWGLIQALRITSQDKQTPLIQRVTAMCARTALKRAPTSLAVTQGVLNDLIRSSGDLLLKTDVPALPRRTINTDQHWLEMLRGLGTCPIFDAAFTADGRLLCALGESGLAVLSPKGRLMALLPIACERIIIPTEGDRYILMMPSGGEWRLSWLEGGSLRNKPWTSARLAHYCSNYDGDCWLVVVDGALYQIDAAGRQVVPWRSLWKVPLPGPVHSMTLGTDKLGLLMTALDGSLTAEFYSSRDLQLRNRRVVPSGTQTYPGVTEEGLLEALFDPNDEGSLSLLGHRIKFQEAPRGPLKIAHGELWSLVEATSELGITVFAVSRAGRGRLVQFVLRAATRVAARMQGHLLVLADDLGSCRVADLQRRIWLRQCSVEV